jgi:hypothetical protein
MTTPTFKLLANALRLGQPPDSMAAFKVLVEVLELQANEIAELRQRVNLLASRVQFAEAKAARLEAASLQLSGSHGAVSPGDLAPIPAMPPAPREPRLGGMGAPVDAPSTDGDGFGGTLNVPRADIDAVVKNLVEREAPYPLAPPGGHRHPGETTGVPFKPARALDPSGGALVGGAGSPPLEPRRAPSRPPPGPAAPSAERPRSVPPPRSPSVPYIAIEDSPGEDTFASTSENAAAELPPGLEPLRPAAPTEEPKLESMVDESSSTTPWGEP